VVTDALHDGQRARVAHAEPFPDDPAQEQLPTGGAVQDHVPGDDVVLRDERCVGMRAHGDPTAGQPLADVVVGVTD
jgi:hypothetical protein